MGEEPRSRAFLVVVAVIGSSSVVSGFGAGDGVRQMCDAIILARDAGISLDVAMATFIDEANLPDGCSLDEAFDHMCSDAGQACSEAFAVPNPIDKNSDDGGFGVATAERINEFNDAVVHFVGCWDNDGAACPVTNCVSASDLSAMHSAFVTYKENVETAQGNQNEDDQDQNEEQKAKDQALSILLGNIERTIEVITERQNTGDACGLSSGGSSGGSSEDTSSTGGEDVDAGTIAGATVGGVVGVAVIGYGLVQANVISFSAFSAAATVSNVAPLVYSEEAEVFI